MRSPHRLLAAACAALLAPAALAGVLLSPADAPDWKVSEWLNRDPGPLSHHRGKVVLIDFFQLWCPGCNSFSIPLFQRWEQLYGQRPDVLIVSIHTVFEGHAEQTPERLLAFVAEKGITHPVGIDAYDGQDRESPITMKRFKTEGTPQVAIVDKEGKLVFSHFGKFDPHPVEWFIGRLLGGAPPQTAGLAHPTAQADPALSGRYRMILHQTAKTCGRKVRPADFAVDLRVLADRLEGHSDRAYLGVQDLSASYDPASGEFTADIGRRVTQGDSAFDVKLRLDGKFVPGAAQPTFDYRFNLKKSGGPPGSDCQIAGKGRGERVAGL